jgi:hypothetical protein
MLRVFSYRLSMKVEQTDEYSGYIHTYQCMIKWKRNPDAHQTVLKSPVFIKRLLAVTNRRHNNLIPQKQDLHTTKQDNAQTTSASYLHHNKLETASGRHGDGYT